ncbi:MAG: hypothetical protein R3B96_09700 [Pirellulaceae bacterium]|nr:hypothetical protein [Planctomycetales bacterium]
MAEQSFDGPRALRAALQQGATLWVHDPFADRVAWLRQRLELPWLRVKVLPTRPGWDSDEPAPWSDLWENREPAALLWEVTSESYVADLQSIVRWRRRRTPTFVAACLRDELTALRPAVRATGVAEVLMGWSAPTRLSSRLTSWFEAQAMPVDDIGRWLASRLPGGFAEF